jgi:hypothetical protein
MISDLYIEVQDLTYKILLTGTQQSNFENFPCYLKLSKSRNRQSDQLVYEIAINKGQIFRNYRISPLE